MRGRAGMVLGPAVVGLWSTIAAVVSALVVLRLGDSGPWPPLVVGLAVAAGVTVVAQPLVAVAPSRRACRPAPRRRRPRPGRARAPGPGRRTRP
jgi:hypothetical protein